jgi:hypothetical protein
MLAKRLIRSSLGVYIIVSALCYVIVTATEKALYFGFIPLSVAVAIYCASILSLVRIAAMIVAAEPKKLYQSLMKL